MNGMKNILGKLTAPKDWKDGLYERINSEAQYAAGAKRITPIIKKPAMIAAGIAAALTVTVTAAALTGFFDLGAALKSDFKDGVSAAKLEAGDYQTLDVSAENDMVSITARAFMGDAADSYIIAEAGLGENAPDDFSRFGLNVIMYDETASKADIKNLYNCCYYGMPQTDENGETVYLFKIRTTQYYLENAMSSGLNLTAGITGAVFENDKPLWRTIKPMDLALSFTPDSSVIKETKRVLLGKGVRMGDSSCIMNSAVFSEYCTRLVLTYNTIGTGETGHSYCCRILNITDNSGSWYINEDFDPASCPVKLIVDGKNVPNVHNDVNSISHFYTLGWNDPLMLITVLNENSEAAGDYCALLSFEPVDFEAAESIVFEVESTGGTEIITVK